MSTFDPVSGSYVSAKPFRVPNRLLKPLRWLVGTHPEKATLDRLFKSQHVEDLRLIVAAALAAALLAFIGGAPGSLIYGLRNHCVLASLGKFGTFFGPVLAVLGAVLAWAYQTGSARLGIVDLFACEMDTICRVLFVVDSVPRAIDAFRRGTPLPGRHFTSQEDYFPVFGSNTKDLQTLEADVVVNITAFYTYVKATRDSTRAFLDLPPSATQPEARPGNEPILSPLQDAARNVIYMMFLGLESARKATAYLVEFEPERVERAMVILLSELEAYRFLLDQFPEQSILFQRLALRQATYGKIVDGVCNIVKMEKAKEAAISAEPSKWEPASRLIYQLNVKRDAVMSWSPEPDPRKPSSLVATA